MNKYETLFLIKPELPDDQVQAILDRLVKQVEAHQGKVASIDHWGQKRLAYPISYRGEQLRRGYYVLITYLGAGETVDEIERNIRINDNTFRYMSVKLEDDVDPASVTEITVTRKTGYSAPPPERTAEAAPEEKAEPEAPAPAAPADDQPADSPAVEESDSGDENKE